MRVSSSGGWTSVIRPHSKRLRSRSSRVTSCLGGRSLESTICLLALCSVLKVWKNSSCVDSLLARNWMSSTSRMSIVAVALAEASRLAVADGVDELVGELLRAHVPHPGAGVEAARVVPDRVQQVRLAEARLPVDEQRVVRLGRRLGDGDRGGVREPVRGADDEGVEEVLRVQPRGRLAGTRRRCGLGRERAGRAAGRRDARRRAAAVPGRPDGRPARRRRAARTSGAAGRRRRAAVGVLRRLLRSEALLVVGVRSLLVAAGGSPGDGEAYGSRSGKPRRCCCQP